jgi:predicted permease
VAVWEKVRLVEKLWPYDGPNPRHADIWRRQAQAFSDLTMLEQNAAGVSLRGDHPRNVGRVVAQPNLLDVLGVQPMLGRNFLPQEAIAGHDNVAIISWNLWQTLFNGNPQVIGQSINMSGANRQVVGVLPRNFYFPKANELSSAPEPGQLPPPDLFIPLVLNPNEFGWNSDYGNYIVLGHVKPGVTIAAAQDELNTLQEQIARQIPPDQLDGPVKGALAAYVQPLKEVIVGRTAPRLWLLLAAVVSVLLIACVNLANAQLARYVARDREAALRSAMGASSAQLLQSALAEVAILSVTGGVLGVCLAVAAVHRFAGYAQMVVPRSGAVDVNFGVLAVSLLLTVGASFIFGVLPALRLLHAQPQQALQGSGRTSSSRGSNPLRRVLVGLQVFTCTTLLLVAGLFARSLIHLSTFDRGFATDHVLVADVSLPFATANVPMRTGFEDGVLAKLQEIPGVQSASLVSYMLLEGDSWVGGITPVGTPRNDGALINNRWIAPGYFATLKQKLLEGRDLDGRDRTAKSAIISAATARVEWPHQDALGRQFKRDDAIYTVVGIVADASNNSLREAPPNMVYLPYRDSPPFKPHFLVRSAQDPSTLAASVRKAIWDYNPEVTIARVHTLDDQLRDSLAPEHLQTTIFIAFGAAALLLALLGIYGTLSYAVEARTREVGIRMALGATRESVYALMLGMIVLPVAAGLVLGWVASLAIGRSLSALLYGTTPANPAVAVPVLLLFAAAALVATLVPCRRAASIEPVEALRAE